MNSNENVNASHSLVGVSITSDSIGASMHCDEKEYTLEINYMSFVKQIIGTTTRRRRCVYLCGFFGVYCQNRSSSKVFKK